MPLAVRTTQTSSDEGRLKMQVGGKAVKAAKKKKLISLIKDIKR